MADTDDQVTKLEKAINRPVDIEDTPLVADGARFDKMGVLGKGGMGEVLLYRDQRIARFVAHKVLHKKWHKDAAFRSRFLLEARVQGQLEHPGIVPVHDLGETPEGELFFSMKCVRGVTLSQALAEIKLGRRVEQYSRRRLLTAFSSVCLAVDFAHSRGVVHRDLKPENVMLGEFGEVYVLDWGIAKVMHGADTPLTDTIELPGSHEATRAGAVLGTPKYMAPEREFGVANPSTDVYALGVMLSDILAAEPDLEISPELERIKLRATSLGAAERYATTRALHDAIERYLDGDRDLEARKKLAEEHAQRAEAAFAGSSRDAEARTEAGRQIGRALGLDPENARAVRTLLQLLTEMPAELPPGALAAWERRKRERRRHTLRVTTLSTGMMLAIAPFVLWMGVLDWPLFAACFGCVVLGAIVQWLTSTIRSKLMFAASTILGMGAVCLLATSMGLLGIVPAALAAMTMGWRMQVERWYHGIMVLLVAFAGLLAPFALSALHVIAPTYQLHDGVLVILPKLHAFPPGRTLISMLFVTFGALAAALLYGRLYVNELRRAELRLNFQAWQLQQLLPPELPADR